MIICCSCEKNVAIGYTIETLNKGGICLDCCRVVTSRMVIRLKSGAVRRS
jgi:hypothetical protein